MLKKIQSQAYRCFVPRETKAAREGTATWFWVRQMSHHEATLYDVDLERTRARAQSLDPDNQAREATNFRCGKFAEVCEKIENYEDDGGEPITDPVRIKQFAIDYLTPDEVEFLLGAAKTGLMLREMDAETLKNA
ncbi:MAG: hypothetical protein FJ280_26730 [Planctomycetes bacterium]|nr:hypothetical protein [Planctomycetota bacterium]